MEGPSVPTMKITPPAVTIGPPKEIDPHLPASEVFSVPGNRPIGFSHFNSPELALTAASAPHGGRLQGRCRPGLNRNRRAIPYGVPFSAANSQPPPISLRPHSRSFSHAAPGTHRTSAP